MATLEKAIEIAVRAHAGQVDKAGQPYILHPLRVMLQLEGEAERMAGVLHDVVEDSTVSFRDLEEAGFPGTVVDAVRALTKLTGESRLDAARRAAQHSVARAVKIVDVRDNMDLSRIAHPTERDFARIEEYKQVLNLLVDGTAVGSTTR